MSVLYQVPMMPPKHERSEALYQEIQALRAHFGGKLLYVNPNQMFPKWVQKLQARGIPLRIPRRLFGFQMLGKLLQLEKGISLHQIYNPEPFPYPYLQRLRKPVVYALVGGAGEQKPDVDFFNRLAAVTVSDPQSLERLQSWGIRNTMLVRPGIDTEKFSYTSAPPSPPFRLLMASAPWTEQQFAGKGVDTLLDVLRLEPDLHITFLWRGLLTAAMIQRVEALGVTEQVTIIDEHVDVNRILAGVHATINLAAHSHIVKAYPNSLLDSLAAGKPVLVSCAIPMAEYVEEAGVGEVVETISAADVRSGINMLRQRYTTLQQRSRDAGQRDFSHNTLLESYEHVYNKVFESVIE